MTVCSKCRIEILLSEKLKTFSYCKKCRAINAKKYRKNNPDKIKERNQEHYYEKRGQERKKIRDKENLEKTRIRDNLRYQEDFNFRMNKKIKKRDNSSIDILGCKVDFFRDWLEFQFSKEMNWENYGDYWNIDHVNPCDNFDFSDVSQQYTCFNWKNTRPMETLLNFSKNNHVDSKLIQEHNKLSNIFLSQYQK